MTDFDDSDFSELDTYIAAQLAQAVETYASLANISAWLKVIREVGDSKWNDGTAATNS